jgi:hypothetical protein
MGFFSLMVKVYKDPSVGFDSASKLCFPLRQLDYYLLINLVDLLTIFVRK